MNKEHLNQTTQEKENNWILLAANCWRLSVAALWPNCIHTEEEQAQVIKLISSKIFQGTDFYKTYLEICQRILLTRLEMLHNPGYGISNHPCRFFNSIEKGFSLSACWYHDLIAKRKQSITYKLELRALAEAILEFSEEPSKENYLYWRNWFITNNATDEWMLYNICTALFLIDNKRSYVL